MRRLLLVFSFLLLPVLGFLAYSPDAGGLPALNKTSGVSARFVNINDGEPGQLADTAGVQYRRRAIYWDDWSEGRGPDYYMSRFEYLDSMGFEPVVVFSGTPYSHRITDTLYQPKVGSTMTDTIFCPDAGHQCAPKDGSMDDFGAWVAEVADSLPYVDYWEVWNEPYKENNDSTVEYGFFFGRVGRLAEVTERVMNNVNVEDQVLGPGIIGGNHQYVSHHLAYLDSLNNRGIMVDGISTHIYTDHAPDGPARLNTLRDTLVDHGYSNDIWLTEFGVLANNSDVNDQVALMDAVFDKVQAESWFAMANWFPWTEQDDGSSREGGVVLLDSMTTTGIEEPLYCNLVSRAGNLSQQGLCPDVYSITGHDMMVPQGVPPSTSCIFQSDQNGGETPYDWEWRVDGVLEDSDEHLNYFTPASGSFVVEVTVIDANGAKDVYEETMNVDSEAMCTV